MSDNDTQKKNKAYASFLEGTALRLYTLLSKELVKLDQVSGNFERHLIGALEIVSGSSIQFIDDDQMIGYQFVNHKSSLSRSQFIERNAQIEEGLDHFGSWKESQRRQNRTVSFQSSSERATDDWEYGARQSALDDEMYQMKQEIRALKQVLDQLLEDQQVGAKGGSKKPPQRKSTGSGSNS